MITIEYMRRKQKQLERKRKRAAEIYSKKRKINRTKME